LGPDERRLGGRRRSETIPNRITRTLQTAALSQLRVVADGVVERDLTVAAPPYVASRRPLRRRPRVRSTLTGSPDGRPSSEPGLLVYVMVENVEETLKEIPRRAVKS
jgi:hypothetical protein